jgi:hypothetical protein
MLPERELDVMKHAPRARAAGLAGTLGPQKRRNDVPRHSALGVRKIDQQREPLAQVQLDRAVVFLNLRKPERLKLERGHEIPPCPVDAQGTV